MMRREALAELNKFLEEHKKAANAAKPPPTPWKPEDEDELLSGESSGGGAGSKKPSESVVAKNGNSAFANESATELISDGRSGAGFESSMQTYEFVERISMGLHKSFKYDYEAEQFDGSEESSSSEGFKPVEDESREDKSDHDLID
ncbi:unnamed protein product [Notodromas monacha]|uniref:Uncharacterized protein n=1 Tax=Notodromas monacha TaxID=399045 RepID=A0A7R9BTU0_9CRUS|nr:unnamed protein product [Notodromas monacha]CAG0920571.1 unnamed protein product [Notodromas monacha]